MGAEVPKSSCPMPTHAELRTRLRGANPLVRSGPRTRLSPKFLRQFITEHHKYSKNNTFLVRWSRF